MPRISRIAKQALVARDETQDKALEEARKVIEKVVKSDGHPFERLSALARRTQDEAVERAALSDLNTYVMPRMRALESETAEKPVAVNINFDLSAAHGGESPGKG